MRVLEIPSGGGPGVTNNWLYDDAGAHVATTIELTTEGGGAQRWSLVALDRCSAVVRIPLVELSNHSSEVMNLIEFSWTENDDIFYTLKASASQRYRISTRPCLSVTCPAQTTEFEDLPIWQPTTIELRIRKDGAKLRVNIENGTSGTELELPPQLVVSNTAQVYVGLRGQAQTKVTYGAVEIWREPY